MSWLDDSFKGHDTYSCRSVWSHSLQILQVALKFNKTKVNTVFQFLWGTQNTTAYVLSLTNSYLISKQTL